MSRGIWGNGTIAPRGENAWRLRYRVGGQRYSVTFRGTRAEARAELRRLLRDGDTGMHVPPDRMTVAQWLEHWFALGCPGRRQGKPRPHTVERYRQLIAHAIPVLGGQRLQKLTGADLDQFYTSLAGKIAPGTQHQAHVILRAALAAAVRAGALAASPMERTLNAPSSGESNHGIALDEDEMRRLIDGFRGSSLALFVNLAAYTGVRRNEALGLRWGDFDEAGKTLKVARAIEQTKAGIGFKPPKTRRGLRTVAIDDHLAGLLRTARERHLRLVAGIPDGSSVDLSLVRLPDDALIFPSPAGPGFDLTRPRDPRAVTRGFVRHARRLGFKGLRLHDLRGSHVTQLLRRGMPIDVVARRLGHDPAVMMRAYAKALPSDDTITRDALAAISGGKGGGA
jgi:integrase